MNPKAGSSPSGLPAVDPAHNDSGFFSSEAVLDILQLILAGSELSEVLTFVARLVESQGKGTLCTIWLPMPTESISIAQPRPVFQDFTQPRGARLLARKAHLVAQRSIGESRSMLLTSSKSRVGTVIVTGSSPSGFGPFGPDPCLRMKARFSALSQFFTVRFVILAVPICS